MAWWVYPAHFVAHVQPVLTTGTADSSYPLGLCRTLDIDKRAKLTPTGAGMEIRFDRGTTSGAALNTILIVNTTMSGGTWSVQSDNDSAFGSPTALVTASANIQRDIFVRFASASSERYFRFTWTQTTGAYYFGLISLGISYQVASAGPQIQTESNAAEMITSPYGRPGMQRWSRSFRNITRANAETILDYSRRYYIYDSVSAVLDGYGGAGGLNPMAIIDDSTSPDVVYYGRARIEERPWAANFSELFVTQDRWSPGMSV